MTIIGIDQFDQITIRAKPGVYVTFPIVDNKGIFDHYTTSNLPDALSLERDANSGAFGLYKIRLGIKYLIHAFSDKSELSIEMMGIIVSHFPHIIDVLDIKKTFTIVTDLSCDPKLQYKIIVNINGYPYLFAKVDDIGNLSTSQESKIKGFPGALEAVRKYILLMKRKTEQAYQ